MIIMVTVFKPNGNSIWFKNCHHDHIPFTVKENGNCFLSAVVRIFDPTIMQKHVFARLIVLLITILNGLKKRSGNPKGRCIIIHNILQWNLRCWPLHTQRSGLAYLAKSNHTRWEIFFSLFGPIKKAYGRKSFDPWMKLAFKVFRYKRALFQM